MRKRTIIIIISFISAFILMSGGYGFWIKPLTIIGNIEVRKLDESTKIDLVPLNPEMLEQDQTDTVNPEASNNPDKSISILPNNQNGTRADNFSGSETIEVTETLENQQDTGSRPIDHPININETGDADNLVNPEQEQAGSEENVSIPSNMVEADEPSGDQINEIDSKINVINEEGGSITGAQNGELDESK